MDDTKQKKVIKIKKGTVVSTKMDKTIIVRVDRYKMHPKYKKRFKVSKRFHVHDPENTYQKGDVVQIREVRPLSKLKRWVVHTPKTAA